MTETSLMSEAGPAPSVNTVAPLAGLPGANTSRLIIDAIQPTIIGVRAEIATARMTADSHFKWLLAAFAAGFVILAGMCIAGFLILDNKLDNTTSQINLTADNNYKDLDNKIEATQGQLIQLSTELSDLLQRLPPATTPLPR